MLERENRAHPFCEVVMVSASSSRTERGGVEANGMLNSFCSVSEVAVTEISRPKASACNFCSSSGAVVCVREIAIASANG